MPRSPCGDSGGVGPLAQDQQHVAPAVFVESCSRGQHLLPVRAVHQSLDLLGQLAVDRLEAVSSFLVALLALCRRLAFCADSVGVLIARSR
jgi:hypothetical protein